MNFLPMLLPRWQYKSEVTPSCKHAFLSSLSRQPRLEQRGSLGALHAAAYGVQHSAAQGDIAVKAEPIRHVQFERFWRDFQFQITYFEEALLKNDAQNLLAERG